MQEPHDSDRPHLEYVAPEITSLGTLVEMTQNVLAGARFATGGMMAALSSPVGGGGGTPITPPLSNDGGAQPQNGGGLLPTSGAPATLPSGGVKDLVVAGGGATGTSPNRVEVGGVSASGTASPSSVAATGNGSGGGAGPSAGTGSATGATGSGGQGGDLPFTGFSVAFIGALSAGLVATGTAIRRKLRRA